jgi:hypothetical protein
MTHEMPFGNYHREIIVTLNGKPAYHYAGKPTEEELQTMISEEMDFYPTNNIKVYAYGIDITNNYIN